SAIASLMFFSSTVLTVGTFEFPMLCEEDSATSCTGGMSCGFELFKGDEDLLTLEVHAVKNSSYKGPNRRSNSYCNGTCASAEEETFCSWGTGSELS
nr:hypothetical protein [Tanacetum cinerariifolium]